MFSVFAITYLQTPQLWRPMLLSCQAHVWLERRLKVIFRLFMVQFLLLTVRLLRDFKHKMIQDIKTNKQIERQSS